MTTRDWTAPETRAWRLFVEMQHGLERHLVWHLQREFDLSGSDFEILVNVSGAGDAGMGMSELARALSWEQSRLSHQLRRMADRGLVTRDTTDRRRHVVTMTERGWAAIRAAAPVNRERVQELFVDVIGPDRVSVMAEMCADVLDALGRHRRQCR